MVLECWHLAHDLQDTLKELTWQYGTKDKWWLISDTDVEVIRQALETQSAFNIALHALDSGLNTSEIVPKDFRKMQT